MKTGYVVYFPCNRSGEFEFLCSSQENMTDSLTDAVEEIKDRIFELKNSYDQLISRV